MFEYQHLGPAGPATRWLDTINDVHDDELRREHELAYDAERRAFEGNPQMMAMRALANHVSQYRMAATFASAIPLASELLHRELELKGLWFDGELPASYVQEHGCAWVGVAEACSLPDYVSCVSAEELDQVARRICADPMTSFDERTIVPSNDIVLHMAGPRPDR